MTITNGKELYERLEPLYDKGLWYLERKGGWNVEHWYERNQLHPKHVRATLDAANDFMKDFFFMSSGALASFKGNVGWEPSPDNKLVMWLNDYDIFRYMSGGLIMGELDRAINPPWLSQTPVKTLFQQNLNAVYESEVARLPMYREAIWSNVAEGVQPLGFVLNDADEYAKFFVLMPEERKYGRIY